MTAHLRLAATPLDRRNSVQQDTRLCLALATAAVSALAALSPAARAAIEASLDESFGEGSDDEYDSTGLLAGLRDTVRRQDDPNQAMARRLEDALVAKAMALPDPNSADQPAKLFG